MLLLLPDPDSVGLPLLPDGVFAQLSQEISQPVPALGRTFSEQANRLTELPENICLVEPVTLRKIRFEVETHVRSYLANHLILQKLLLAMC